MTVLRSTYAAGLVLFVGLSISARSQETEPDPAARGQETKTDPTSADPEASPVSSLLGDVIENRFTVFASGEYRQEYDDNVFNASTNKLSDHAFSLGGRLSAVARGKRLAFEGHYVPHYRLYSEYSQRNRGSHQFENQINYAATAHTSLRWHGSVARFDAGSSDGSVLLPIGDRLVPVFRPDALEEDASTLSANGSLGMEHQFSRRSRTGFTIHGTTYRLNRETTAPFGLAPSSESYSAGSTVHWSRSVSPALDLGVEAGHNYIALGSSSSHTNYQYGKLTATYRWAKGYQMRVGAGPSVELDSRRPDTIATSYAVDASFQRFSQRNSLGLSYTDGTRTSYIESATRQRNAAVFFQQALSRRWSAIGSAAFSQSSTTVLSGDVESISASARLAYRVQPNWSIFGGYSWVRQSSSNAFDFNRDFERNLFSFGLSYDLGPILRR
jgi:hypothetical protein